MSHMPRQHSCRGMCDIVIWSDHQNHDDNLVNFRKISLMSSSTISDTCPWWLQLCGSPYSPSAAHLWPTLWGTGPVVGSSSPEAYWVCVVTCQLTHSLLRPTNHRAAPAGPARPSAAASGTTHTIQAPHCLCIMKNTNQAWTTRSKILLPNGQHDIWIHVALLKPEVALA